jgi:hypothetical protein
MKITRAFLRNLLKEAKGDKSCKRATQDSKFNSSQKMKAAKSKKIAYGEPNRPELKKLVKENKLCGNCGAFDVTKKMQSCMKVKYPKNVSADFLIKGKKKGYCLMHDFMCSGHKTCLTWGSGGPKK